MENTAPDAFAVLKLRHNPSLRGLAEEREALYYSRAGGVPLTMRLMTPLSTRREGAPPVPGLLFVQGSAWTSPNLGYALPQLAGYAREGLAVATISHRSSTEGFPFPAFLEDVKTALRCLKARGEEWGIDPERIGVFGTSSGGNAALLAGVTSGDPRYGGSEYPGYPDGVKAVVSCFGPTDLPALFALNPEVFSSDPIFTGLSGNRDPLEVMREMSPLLHVRPGREYPAFLLVHGDRDELVPFAQSEAMARSLKDAGARAQLVRVTGGPHEGSFWSPRLHRLILDFLKAAL